MKVLDFNEKQDIKYCVSTLLRDEQIKINITKVKERIGEPSETRTDEPIAIVCFGPSLKDTWEELKKFKYIMTCSGAHKFLIERGIIPTWHLDLEPREHKIKMLGQPHPDVEYLIASTVHPKYFDQLQGYNVKLWHIFATDDEADRILPKGEWALTGGSSVGLRCMTMARYMGFTNQHIFGMDGSSVKESFHADFHPNTPPNNSETEYNGKKFITTPSILFCAKETFKELDQMPDIKPTFYGEGLVQEMFKNYIPNPKRGMTLAFNRPELISKEKIELDWKLHRDNPNYGMGGAKHADTILKLVESLEQSGIKRPEVLDYGCGKGMLAKALKFSIQEYDPAIPGKKEIPKPADIVVCTDVLEHIEPDKLQFVLNDLARCVKQIGYFVISTRKAIKTYSNGQNTHSIVQGKDWWNKKLSKHFEVGTIINKEKEAELHIVVGPKKIIQPDITNVEKNGVKVKFYTPNETTKWRAETLFTKEPSTIDWINSMQKDEVLFDVGANIGSYSIIAGVKGVKVYSFEPEAGNYALLVKNMSLNNIDPNAYCVAISDEEKIGTLYAGQAEVGGACHSFNEPIGPDLNPREFSFTQGCIGVTLDSFISKGLPSPHHLKIDVDGLEYKVIKGADHILKNGLKSLLVEVNPSLPQHQSMIKHLQDLGFDYDQSQVDRATRKDGAFKGCAEYIFKKKKTTPLIKHVVNRIEKTELDSWPFNYLWIDNIFTDNVFNKILKNLPEEWTEIEKSRGTKGYPLRYTAMPKDEFWDNLSEQLLSGEFKKAILDKFGIKDQGYAEDLVIIKDLPGYSITPHTDSTSKVISVLFYLPDDDSMIDEGTCIYEPNEEGFECKIGRHYSFEDFKKVAQAPFKPNSALAFARTDNSFHGVPPCNNIRKVLLYNIKVC